jgi:polygalacturonase
LQAAVDQKAQKGGGTITIAPGNYRIRTIRLKSGITLNIENGATLTASPDRRDYKPVGYETNEFGEAYSAIYAIDAYDIALTGSGEIDLNGSAFYHMDTPLPPTTTGPAITDAHRNEAPRTYDWRPNQPIFFHNCTGIRIDSIRVRNAPCWTFCFNRSQSIIVRGVRIDNGLTIPNCDGLHFCSSRDITVTGCHIVSGDDCIAFSSINDWNAACENIAVSDCIFQSSSKAISLSYMHSIVRNVVITNIIVKKSNRACVAMVHPRTGLLENVLISNCIFEGRTYGGGWWGNGEPLVVMVTPHHLDTPYRDPKPDDRFAVSVKNISFSHIICRGERPPAFIASEKGLVQNIRINEMHIDIVDEELTSLKGNVIDLAPGQENFPLPGLAKSIIAHNVDDVEYMTS